MGYMLGNKLGIEFGLFNFLYVNVDLLLGYVLKLIPELIYFRTLSADHDAGPCGMNCHGDLLWGAVYYDLGDTCPV